MSSNSLAGVRNVVSLLTLTTALCFAFPAAAETIAGPAGAGSAGSVPLQAQSGEQEADSAPPALSDLERADSLLQAVDMLSDSAFALAERIPGTRGEDRALLGQRIRRLVAEGEALTGPLIDLLESLDQSDPQVQAILEELTTEIAARNRDLQGLVRAVRVEVDEADQARDTVSAEGLVVFDEMRLGRSQTLDQTLTALYDNNDRLARLGGDTLPVWEFLDPVITERAEDLAARIGARFTPIWARAIRNPMSTTTCPTQATSVCWNRTEMSNRDREIARFMRRRATRPRVQKRNRIRKNTAALSVQLPMLDMNHEERFLHPRLTSLVTIEGRRISVVIPPPLRTRSSR